MAPANMRLPERSVSWGRLAAALLLAAVVLTAHRHAYWRPFDDTAQESIPSFHAYGFAAANGAGLWPNPLVARDIDIRGSHVRPYPHWPNGFFLLFEGVLRVFGRTEQVGRWFAILGVLLGFTLVVVSLGRDDLLLYGALPLILLSAMGRDAIPFVFIDVALYVSIGVLLWITAHLAGSRRYNLVFRAAMVTAVFFNQLVAPFAVVILILKWRESRSTRDLLADLAVLAAGTASVMLALAAGAGDLRPGLEELRRTFQLRSSEPFENWYGALNSDLGQSLNLEPVTSYVVAAAWLVLLGARQWRTVILLPSFLLFTLLLRSYVFLHHFARLPFVFFSLVTLVVAVEVMLERLERAKSWGHGLAAAARILVAVALAARLSATAPQYGPSVPVQATRGSLMRITSDPGMAAALERCNAFEFHLREGPNHHFDPHDRMGQFFFGRQVVERVRRGEPVRTCVVDLTNEAVRGPF